MSGIVRESDSADETCYKTLRIAERNAGYYLRDRSSWEEDEAELYEMVGDQTNQAWNSRCNFRGVSRVHQSDHDN
jgi:hypothetical protein